MSTDDVGIKRVVLFYSGIAGVGGEEKLLFEEARYLEAVGIKTHILTYKYTGAYSDAYRPDIEIIGKEVNSKLIRALYRIIALRKRIKEINPGIIISHGSEDCISLYFATLFTRISYVVHTPETIFRSDKTLEKYALIHRKVFNEIRDSTIGGREFISKSQPKLSLVKRIIVECYAVAMYIGIKRAKKIFVLSNQMKWEVNKLYGKDAIVLKGAFSSEIFDYKPKQNIKEKLGLIDKKMILNVNRLDPRKRVDLVMKAFNQICDEFDDIVLVIGGVGPDEEKLKNLTKELDLEDKVKFMGYIPEEERKDYCACCDVFVHPNWADFAIAPYEALVLQKNVVWSSEMEMDENLATNKHIFIADPTVDDFAEAIKKALVTEVTEKYDLSDYTWGEYFSKIRTICEEVVK